MHIRLSGLALAVWLISTASLPACSLCVGDLQRQLTLREETQLAQIVLIGTLQNPRLVPGSGGLSGGGATDLKIKTIVKNNPFLKGKHAITIPRYIPVDAKQPPQFIVFCDLFNGKLDPYRGTPLGSKSLATYLEQAMKLDAKKPRERLKFFYNHLDAEESEIARDAFLEFAKASDQDVAAVASELDPAKLRRLLTDTGTPAERLGIFAYLLGACGKPTDAEVLRQLLGQRSERVKSALSGLLGGYIELQPKAGWALASQILKDPMRSFSERLAVLGTVRFFQASKAMTFRPAILSVVAQVIQDGDLADLVIEDLRRWQWWDLTKLVLQQISKPTHAAPLVQRSIVRYALSCPKPEAKVFVAKVREQKPALVKELEEALAFEAK